MTLGDIESKVRTLVNDTQEPYRFDAKVVRGFIIDAVRHLRNINPSERYGADGRLDETLPDLNGEQVEQEAVRILPRHEEAVIKYAAHLIYQLDMTDTVNLQISETLRTRAEALMQL